MASADSRIPLAVLGDSDSHSYGDGLWFSRDGDLRGGRYRRATLQWTEALERLRGDEIDQGPWGTWGTWPRLARVASLFGIYERAPRKEDYRYNFAVTGTTCRHLVEGVTAQTSNLLALTAESPGRWRNGIVQVRTGINTLGTRDFLDRSAAQGLSGDVASEVAGCADAVAASAQAIRAALPSVRIVLVGILNNSDWPPYFDRWQSAVEQRNIEAVLDAFDARLSAIAAADERMAFFDDRAWFTRLWGGRDADGKPAYKSVSLGGAGGEGGDIEIPNSQGNGPWHAILNDGHGGTMLNAIWSRDFIDFLNERFDLGLTPVTDAELRQLAGSLYGELSDSRPASGTGGAALVEKTPVTRSR